ncbi:unnamed protein product, partial [Prorocentrum cordatum]
RQQTHDHKVHAPIWAATLGKMMEVNSEAATHFCKSTNSINIIDRFFCSATGWMMCQLMTEVNTVDTPEHLSSQGISDHAALSVRLRLRGARPASERPIPKHIFTSVAFQRRLRGMVADSDEDLLRWSPPVATEHYKYMMKEAAREARNILFYSAPDLPGTLQLVARGIARAVWRQDAALALKLIETSQHAADALTVDGQVVSLRHAPSFEQWAAGVHRLVRERTAALAAYWTPVFSRKEPHPVMTQMYLDRFLTKASDIDLHCPLTSMFRKVLRRARHSAPGVDGLPYAAWSACDYGAQHLARMFGWLCQGQSLFASASVTLQVLAFVGWMYLAVEGVVHDGGRYATIFWIRSGIIQGCGLSGSLYALASSPMLADLERSIEHRRLGICRACADDLGAVLYELASLRILVRVLGVMEKIAGLKIKISKCTLVPLVGGMTETLKTMTQAQLASIAGAWS